jgi:type I restriction enzyme M protein
VQIVDFYAKLPYTDTAMPSNNAELEEDLRDAADELRANSRLRAADYSIPVLGLIFLKYADHRFGHATEQLEAEAAKSTSRRRRDLLSPDRYKAAGVLYLPDEARYQHLVQLPGGEHVGRAINAKLLRMVRRNRSRIDYLEEFQRLIDA